ncbi:RND family transporter [Candidatus Poribacteria bacterium]
MTANIIVKLRWLIIIAFIVVTVIIAIQIPNAKMDADMMNYMPRDMPSRVNKDKIEELFGGTEMLMILVKADDVLNPTTLERVKKLSKQMKKVKGVDKVMSLFELKYIKSEVRSEDEVMIVNPAVKRIPKTEAQKESLRKEIIDNDVVYGSVVSEDFTVTGIIAVLDPGVPDEHIVGEAERLIAENPGEEEVIIGGTPYSRLNVSTSMRKDFRRLLPFGLLIMLIFLYFCFRQLRGVFLPFLVVIMSIVFSMGLIPLLGWKISVITILLPVFLIAVANDYGIHMIAKYQEDNVPGNSYSNKELAKSMFSSLGKPILLTGVTTMAGMLCLLGHILIPAGQLGILAAFGIVFALGASLLFIPAIISLIPKSKPVILPEGEDGKRPVLERLLGAFGDLVSRRPRSVIIGALVFSAIAAIGVFFVVVDADPIKYYSKDHPVTYAADLINENLGGWLAISVAFEGDIKEPRILKDIDRLEREIGNIPEIGNTLSIARVVRQMSRVLNDEGEDGYDRVPDTRDAIAQYFEFYSMSGDPDDFEKMVDFPYEHALINVRVNTSSTPKVEKVIKQVNEMAKNYQDVKYVGGISAVFTELARSVVNGQFLSLIMATIVVSILLMITFRSVIAGLIAAIPLALSMAVLFGLMGLLSIELNIATALLSSIMIGVGVDYTIHFLWRYREERQNGLMPQEAVKRTLTTTGRGIVFNALSVIVGFVVLLVSTFLPVRFFGFLVVVSIFSCLLGALILVPALCLVLRPKFLEPKN